MRIGRLFWGGGTHDQRAESHFALRWPRGTLSISKKILPVLFVSCHVFGVYDGDTFTCGDQKIRIAEIDAPEKKQPYGTAAKKALSDIIFDRDVELAITGTSYTRKVATVKLADTDVAAEMVRAGNAWVSRGYVKDAQRMVYLTGLECAARSSSAGLWAGTPIPPWNWR